MTEAAVHRIDVVSGHVTRSSDTSSDNPTVRHRSGSGELWNGSREDVQKAVDIFLEEGVTNFPLSDPQAEARVALSQLHTTLRSCEEQFSVADNTSRLKSSAKIFLTGATGFIGSHMLAKLTCTMPESLIYCLVRGKDSKHCLERLKKAAAKNVTGSVNWDRVVAIPGDMRDTHLGMGQAMWTELIRSIDTVLHFAGKDNFFMPFSVLKAFHIDAVQNIIEFCASGYVKPLLYVSSCKYRLIEELNGRIIRNDGLYDGYAQSKFVGHKLAEEIWHLKGSMKCVPPIQLVNLGYVYSDIPATPDITDAWEVVMKVCLLCDVVPDIDVPMDFVPVTYVTSCVREIMDKDEAPGLSTPPWFEIWHPDGLRFKMVRDAIEAYRGKPSKVVSMPEFADHWRSVLQKVGTVASKCLSVGVTDTFEEQTTTVFKIGPACYTSQKIPAPLPLTHEFLVDYVRTVDTKMSLK